MFSIFSFLKHSILKKGIQTMRNSFAPTLITFMSAVLAFAAASPAIAQPNPRPSGPSPWGTSTNYNTAGSQYGVPPGSYATTCFEWIDFEHAWAKGGVSPSFQVNPSSQPPGFANYGYDKKINTGMPGYYAWPVDTYNYLGSSTVLANQTSSGAIYLPSYTNSRTASASSGSSSATATANINMYLAPTPGGFVINPSVSGSASGSAGSAYKYASSTGRFYVNVNYGPSQSLPGRWTPSWTHWLAGSSTASTFAMGNSVGRGAEDEDEEYDLGAIRPSGRSLTVATVKAPDGAILLQDTLGDVSSVLDFSMVDGVEASIHWEENQLTFTNVRDGRFHVKVAGQYVDPEDRGEIDVRKHNGVVTTSRATGIYKTVPLPAVGTSGNFVVVLPQTGDFDFNIPALGPDFDFDTCATEVAPPAIWGGDGTDPNWSSQNNWLYTAPPENDVPIYFTGLLPGGLAVSNNDLPAGTKINALIFRPEVNANYTVQGNSIVLDGLVQNAGIFSHQINLDMVLPADGATFDTVPGDLVVAGVISGEGGLRKTGPGILTLSGNNEYTGGTTISDGVLELAEGGDIASSPKIDNEATFRINGGDHTVGAITGDGSTEINSGALAVDSISQNTLSIGTGCKLTIRPIPGGYTTAYAGITPVPEPATGILLVLAAAGLLSWRARIRGDKSVN
jgi:autotransporter-associated beta strand protein